MARKIYNEYGDRVTIVKAHTRVVEKAEPVSDRTPYEESLGVDISW